MIETYRYEGVDGGIVSSMRIEKRGGHYFLRVWNRGALAGELAFLEASDAEKVAKRLEAFGRFLELPPRLKTRGLV